MYVHGNECTIVKAGWRSRVPGLDGTGHAGFGAQAALHTAYNEEKNTSNP